MERHIQAFLEALRNRAVSEHTLSAYESDLRDFESFLKLREELALEHGRLVR